MKTPDVRLITMFLGWIVALYGVRRRDWPGTMIALSGLGVADAAMIIGASKPR